MRQSLTAIRPTAHFIHRLHERFPGVKTTEGELARTLAEAEWYAGGGRCFYAIRQLGGRLVVFVAAVREGLVELVTLYEPKAGWDRRLSQERPWPFALIVAAGAC
jgi:hypothetical protein